MASGTVNVQPTAVMNAIYPTISNAENYSGFGNTFYRKFGNLVQVHVGIKGLVSTAIQGAKATIFTLPSGYIPDSAISSNGQGGNTYTSLAYGIVGADGTVKISSDDQYAMVDFLFIAVN